MDGGHVTCNRGYSLVISGEVTQPDLRNQVNRSGDTAVNYGGMTSGVGLDHVGGVAPQELENGPCSAEQSC